MNKVFIKTITFNFISGKFPSERERMKADIIPFPILLPARLRELAGPGMEQAEVTPVEIKTSVTRLPHGVEAKRFRRRGPPLWVRGDRVWSLKQEAPCVSEG